MRLSSVLTHCPKVLAPVNGRPFLSYLLDWLVEAGFAEVILCTGYKGEQVRDTFGERYKRLSIRYSRELKPLGTGGSVRHALPLIATDTVLVMNGDSYIDADLNIFLDWFFHKKAEACVLLKNVPDTSRYGRVEVDEDGRVLRFEEKRADVRPGWINAGVYILKTSLLETIPAGRTYSLENGWLPGLVGKEFYGYRCEADFIDIGTPESYAKAEEFLPKVC